MITEPWGSAPGWPVSITNSIEVEFSPDHSENGQGPSVKVISDRHGKFEVWERIDDGEFLLSRENFQKNFVKLSKTPGRVSYSTWFGLEINHGGKTASVRVPQYYSEQVEGLCGNFLRSNFIKILFCTESSWNRNQKERCKGQFRTYNRGVEALDQPPC